MNEIGMEPHREVARSRARSVRGLLAVLFLATAGLKLQDFAVGGSGALDPRLLLAVAGLELGLAVALLYDCAWVPAAWTAALFLVAALASMPVTLRRSRPRQSVTISASNREQPTRPPEIETDCR